MPTVKLTGIDNRTEGGKLAWDVSVIGPRGSDPVTFGWRILPGSGDVGTEALGDGTTDVFGTLEGTGTIPGDLRTKRISIDIDPDKFPEPDEYIILEVFDVIGADMPFDAETLQETAWIESSDGGPRSPRSAFVSDVTVTEPENGVAQAVFQFDTPNEPYRGFALIYRTVSGTATAGVDFVTTTGTREFPRYLGREETQFVTVDILADVETEGPETFTIEIADRSVGFGTILATGTATINDTPPPVFTLGTPEADDLLGSPLNDLFDLLDGDDSFYARGGDDQVLGRGGHDLIRGEAGDDIISGGAGRDTLAGGDGNDSLKGDNGNDTLYGGAGDDVLSGGNDNDLLEGNAGNDVLEGQNGDDILYGKAGNDLLSGGFGLDALYGGVGDDTLQGDDGNDTLGGGAGIDNLDGGRGDDLLIGGTSDDALLGGGGDDTLRGEEGNDTINGGNGADLIFGGAGNDSLTDGDIEGAVLDRIYGGAGNDTLRGGFFDLLYGGEGDDLISLGPEAKGFGGAGNDIISVRYSSTAFGGAGDDTINLFFETSTAFGGVGDDEFVFSQDGGEAYGGAGDDIFVSFGQATMDGGAGDDLFVSHRSYRFDHYLGRANPDTITGFQGAGIAGGDGIELRSDADVTQEGVQDFIFFGALGPDEDNTDVPAGAIWLVDAGLQTRILGRAITDRPDDDRRVDFAININDGAEVSAADYTIDDFIL